MRASELFEGLPASQLHGGDVDILAICVDSREVQPGTLFIARKGWYVDGHAYLQAAVSAGASAVLISDADADWASLGVPVFYAPDEDPLLGLLASRFYGYPTRDLTVIGVTGTNGKTSTAWMVDHLLRTLGVTTAFISTVAYRIGERWLPAPNTTPDAITIQRLAREARDAGAQALVMEVSSHGAAIGRIAGTEFTAAGYTNLTRDHLDFHGDDASYARAKALFFSLYARASAARRGQPPRATFMLQNATDADVLALARRAAPAFDERLRHLEPLAAGAAAWPPLEVTTVTLNAPSNGGSSSDASTRVDGTFANRIHVDVTGAGTVAGTPCVLQIDGVSYPCFVPAAGDFQVQNAVLAMSLVRDALGSDRVSWPALIDALQSFTGVPGRMELVCDPQGDEPAVFVDYAHTPDAVRTVLATARGLQRPPLCCVVGAGGDRDRGKRPTMAHEAEVGADHVIVTSDNPRTEQPEAILAEVVAGLSVDASFDQVVGRREAIALACERQGGTVVIAGKGHERYEDIARRRTFWDDREEARSFLAKRRFSEALPRRLSGWSLETLAQHVEGTLVATSSTRVLLRTLSSDTRTLRAGDIFVALKGAHHDGHAHVAQAFAQGAAVALVEAVPADAAGPCVVVDSTLRALERLTRALVGNAKASRQGLDVIAITGSNGKTTTRSFIEGLLHARDGAAPLATIGNFNNQIGLPLSVASLALTQRRAVLEMGANRFGDIAELCAMVAPDVAVLTSIGASHLAGFGSIDGVRRAKAEMLRVGKPRLVVLPDSELEGVWGEEAAAIGATCVSFGGASATLEARRATAVSDVELIGHGPWEGWTASVPLPVPGRHNASNLAAAVLAASVEEGALQAPPDDALLARFVALLEAPPGRMERYAVAEHTVIFDAYNANPTSTRAALDVLREEGGSRIAVLGELFELGDDEARLHAEVLAYACEAADVVVTVGPRWHALTGSNVHHFLDRDDAASFIGASTTLPSTVLWKGSRGARLEQLRDVVEARWRKGAI